MTHTTKHKNLNLGIILLLSLTFILILSGVGAVDLYANYSSKIGDVNSMFYGANTGGKFLAGDGVSYGTKISGTETYLNVTEYRNAWTDMNLKLRRYDMLINTFYSNSSDGTNNLTGNLTQIQQDIKWAYDNNQKVLLIANKMPTWLADNSDENCTSDLRACPPYNYTKWGDLVIDFINKSTSDGAYISAIYGIEVWNEPNVITFLWPDYSSTDGHSAWRSLVYQKIYNATLNAMKTSYPNIPIGGFANLFDSSQNRVFWLTALGNLSNNISFFSWHRYNQNSDTLNYYDLLNRDYNNVCANMTITRGNCNVNYILSEYNSFNSTILNYSNLRYILEHKLSLAMTWGLNTLPSNLSMVLYTFGADANFTSGYRYSMFSGKQLDSWYSQSYNTTKTISNLCPSSSEVYNSTSSDSTVKIVSCSNQKYKNVIITNTNNANVSITLNSQYNYTNYLTGAPIWNGVSMTMTPYEVLYLSYTLPWIYDYNQNNIVTSNRTHTFYYNITIPEGLSSVKWNWNNVNYSIYDDSLVLFYNFDNRSSLGENDTHVVDLSKYGNNGTVVGGSNISWSSSGKYGGGYEFSGRINKLNAGINYSEWTNFSISMWVKLNGSSNVGHFLIGNDDTGDNRFYLWINKDTRRPSFGFGDTSITASSLSYDRWYFITFNANFNKTYIFNKSIYVNGVFINSTSANRLDINSNNLSIGYLSGGGGYSLNGSLDNLFVFNKSLSSEDIKRLYSLQLNKYDNSNWSFIINESLNAGQIYNYNLCISNLSNTQNCSNINSIKRNTINIQSEFSSIIKSVPKYYYGISQATSTSIFVSGRNVSNSLTGSSTPLISDYEWHRTAFRDSGLNYIRQDMGLGNLYSNSSDGSINMTGNTTTRQEQLLWAYQNNYKILYIIDYMPTWLADNSTGYCNSLSYCPPYNYTIYSDIVNHFINNVTKNNSDLINNIELEFWNEPDIGFFMGKLSTANITKSSEYNKFYNSTYYAVKGVYPNVPFGGPALAAFTVTNDRIVFMNNWLANTTNERDFISWHDYDSQYSDDYSWIIANCSLYGGNCDRIIISESNMGSDTLKNDSSRENEFANSFSLFYYYDLNYANLNITRVTHKWTDQYPYGNTNGGDYPDLFSMVYEPQQQNKNYYSPYNVTKSFATYCPAGGKVYTSTSDDDYIKPVACEDVLRLYKNLILINTNTEEMSVSVNVGTSFGNTELLSSTGERYPINSLGEVQLGNMDSYEILYLRGYTPPTESQIACNSMLSYFSGFPLLIGLVGTVFFLGIIILLVGKGFISSGESISTESIVFGLVALIGIALLVIVGIVVIGSLCI